MIEILYDKPLMAAIGAWFLAQTIKAILLTIKQKKFRFDLYSLPGGFPSSHSASVSALAVSIGMIYGFDSALFAISAVLAFFFIYDAKVIRGAAGKQAQSLNILIEAYNESSEDDMEKVKERLGHSILEILGGIIIGTAIGVIIVILY
jgi:uncharacterized protein